MKWLLKILAVLVISLPLSLVGTFMLGPLWAWVEETHGIESVGHALYAGWCFVATYGAIVFGGLALVAALTPSKRPRHFEPQ